MQIFKIDLRKILYAATFVAICSTIYTLQQSRTEPGFVFAPHFMTQPLQSFYDSFADTIGRTSRQYLDLLSLKEKMGLLQINNQELKAQLQVLAETQAENGRLKKLISLRDDQPAYDFVAAKVTSKDLFTDHFSLFVNKGAEDGVTKLSGVIGSDGVIGYIIDIENRSSRLLLLNDRLTSIDATVQRTRSRGIISGYSANSSILKFIDRPHEINVGDLIVTSGDQKLFPVGYPIGEVTSVYVSPSGVGHYALVKPSTDLKKLEEVIILRPKTNDKN